MSDVNDNDEVFLGFELASCRGSIGSSNARYADGGGCVGNSESTGHNFFFQRVHRACWPPTLMPRLDERRCGESTKLRRRWFGAPTVVLRENRRSRSLMTVRRFTAQCLPPLRNKRNSTGDRHAAEFQT